MRVLIALVTVLMMAAVCGGCRSGPDAVTPAVTIDPLPMMRLAGAAAVDAAVLSGKVTPAQLVIVRPYIVGARDVCAAAPADRPAALVDALLAQIPAEAGDTQVLRYYLAGFASSVRVEMKPDVAEGVERANALTAAFFTGCLDAIGRLTGEPPPA